MAIKRTCIVTCLLATGAGFCVREDNDEMAYIPASVVKELELEEFDDILAVLTKNNSQPDKTPWFVTRAVVLEEEDA